jgi:ABC-2 type transport system permease protein
VLLALQYRADFVVAASLEVVSTSTALVPLFVVFERRTHIAGVSFEEALLVAAVFTSVQGIVEGAMVPSLGSLIEHVRTGTLDFVLLLPADAQLLVSTSRFQPFRFVNLLTGGLMAGFALVRLGRPVSPADVALALLTFGCGVSVLYAIVLLAVTASFFVIRADNLAYLVTSVLDAGRWPVRVFRGAVRWAFTFVFPLAVVTTFPADALRGALAPSSVALSLATGLGFLVVSRIVFQRALRRYASASS